MKKEKWFVVVGILLFIGGIIVLFNGTNIGIGIADKILHTSGALDTEKYYFLMKSNALSYQIGGGIIALVGGICAIVFGSKNSKNSDL